VSSPPTAIRWTTLASTESISETAAGRTLLFRVGSTVYGCDIDAVREILPYRRATRLPGAPTFVQGLVNIRGTIVTVIDLGVRLEPSREAIVEGSIIMAEHGARLLGVVVEEVMDVRVLSREDGALPANDADAVVRGVGHADDTVVVLLDVHTLIKHVLLS
jgi:purine-binding chemotaxis protein CheW